MGSSVVQKIRQAHILHWNYFGFLEIPEELKDEGAHIQEIYLKCNKLSQLPPWLGSLSNLTNLYLHGNELTQLPEEIGELEQLTWLDVDSNQLSCLPRSLWGLHQLTALVVSNNRLATIPPDIGQLAGLEYLDVSHNALGELPDALGQCQRLRELTTDGNPLLTLPGAVTGLPNLRVVTAMDCHLVYLPPLPFASRPMLRLDHNAGLTYLPAHVMQHTRNVHYIRFAEYYVVAAKKLLKQSLDYSRLGGPVLHAGSQHRLVMPPTLWHICRPHTRQVTPLYELALRAAHASSARLPPLLPASLWDELRRGPTARCSRHECQAPIFHYATLWAIQEPHIVAALFFCSHRCCAACREPCKSSLVTVDWD